jgi:hypothetical protein
MDQLPGGCKVHQMNNIRSQITLSGENGQQILPLQGFFKKTGTSDLSHFDRKIVV